MPNNPENSPEHIKVKFEGDIQMPLVVSEEDIFVGNSFEAGHHGDVGRNPVMEVEITRINRRWRICGPIKSVRVEKVKRG